jgi:hypothetical protein
VSAVEGPEKAEVRLPDSVSAAWKDWAPAGRNAARMNSLPLFHAARMSPPALETRVGLPLLVGRVAMFVPAPRTPLVRVLVLIAGLEPFTVPK